MSYLDMVLGVFEWWRNLRGGVWTAYIQYDIDGYPVRVYERISDEKTGAK